MIGRSFSHYTITAELGRGGMGVVYRATDTKLGREVALKFLAAHLTNDPLAKERFVREARAAAVLRHDAVCAIHDVQETDDGQVFIVMPFYEGQTLKEVLAQGPVSEARAFDIVAQVAAGLQAAHEKGMVHRDIKPANILLTPDDRVKILDFGLAKRDGDMDLTQSSSTVGTVAYMSPEQVQNLPVDARSDLWSLGVLFYELLMGVRPFTGAYEAAVIYGIVNQDVALEGVPERAAPILRKLLAKDLEARYGAAADVVDDVSAQPAARQVPAVTKATRSNHIRNTLLATVAVAILALGAIRFMDRTPATTLPTVAVMYVENNTERERFGNVIQDMLARNLGQVDHLQVLSNQRLKDILRQKLGNGQEALDAATASAVARQAGIQTMIIGSVVQFGEQYVFEVELTDVKTGAILDAVSVTAANESEIMAAVNELTEGILRGSGTFGNGETGAIRIQDVSTSNLTAYELYERGEHHMDEWRFDEAARYFREAIRTDSSFVAAYVGVSMSRGVLGLFPLEDNTAIRELLKRGVRHADKANAMERDILAFRIRTLGENVLTPGDEARRLAERYPTNKQLQFFAAAFTQDSTKFDYFDRLLDLDPGYFLGYNELAYAHMMAFDRDAAVTAARRYRAMLPGVQNSLDSAWEVILGTGREEEAIAILTQALEDGVDPSQVHWRRMLTYAIMGDTLNAWADWNASIGLMDQPEPVASFHASLLAIVFGQWERARLLSAAYVREARRSYGDRELLDVLRNHAALLHALGHHAEAERLLDEAVDISWSVYTASFNPIPVIRAFDNAVGYAFSEDTDGLERWHGILQKEAEAPGLDARHRMLVDQTTALLMAATSASPHAVRRILANLDGTYPFWMYPSLNELHARYAGLTGHMDEARNRYSILEHGVHARHFSASPHTAFFLMSSVAQYRMGRMYEELGDRATDPAARDAALDSARETYGAVVDRWQATGATFHYVADARERLAGLGGAN
jgi:serine/threonine protein kinase/tetratricopeptide (TPR) repeat protein